MTETRFLRMGMSVDLIMAPGDIRGTSVRQADDTGLVLNQTTPPLDRTFMHRYLLVTFKDGTLAVRSGFKARVTGIRHCDDGTGEDFIAVEKGEDIETCELRKYPRFNPGLLDRILIYYEGWPWELSDLSAGGARVICRSGNLHHLNKGDNIRLEVAIGAQTHQVDVQVLRIRIAGEEGEVENESWELAVAFMEWEKLVTDVLAGAIKT